MTQNIDNDIRRKTTARLLCLCMLFIVLATGSATAQGQQQQTGVVVHGNVYGGGNQADVKINTEVNMITGTVEGNVYGGGNLGSVGTYTTSADMKTFTFTANTGTCSVTINNGTIGTGVSMSQDGTFANGNVYGAGKGEADTYWCEKAMTYKTNVTISGGTINGTVYGGGQISRVENDATVIIGEENPSNDTPAPIIAGNVFGAGAGLETHGYSALLRGDTKVTIQGNARIGLNVYGGGEKASVGRFKIVGGLPSEPESDGSGDCTVNIQGGAIIGTNTDDNITDKGNVFGTCKGVTLPTEITTANYKDYKSMQAVAQKAPVGTVNNDWDWVDGYENEYYWVYYPNLTAYQSFLNTLALASHPVVTIGGKLTNETTGAVTPSGNPTVNGSVFGGGQRGITLGTVAVNIAGGTVNEDVYGGGALADTNKGNWVEHGYVEATDLTEGATLSGTFYTRSGTGTEQSPYVYTETSDQTAGSGKYYRAAPTWTDPTLMSTKHPTTVNLLGGTIKGNAYGGGLGDKGNSVPATYYTAEEATAYNTQNNLNYGDEGYVSEGDVKTTAVSGVGAVEAMVYGDINVNLGSSSGSTATAFYLTNYTGDHSSVAKSGRVFGCNNLNGSPQGNVTVTVWKTVTGKNASGGDVTRTPDSDGDGVPDKNTTENPVTPTYELAAVYGGGNLANYAPSTTGKKASVIIETCQVSVHSVYGGGNAAAVPETDVLVKGAYEIAEVFGGGNGNDQYTLNGTDWNPNPGANVNGDATTLLKGGYIHEAYGGSNSLGTISGSVSINKSSGGICTLQVDDLYGAGKNADIEGDLIIVMGCSETRTENVYGCSKNANVKGNVEMTITSGEFGKVFGGNNESGSIFGHIIVNIEEVGCSPIIIEELYLGGNNAAYSVYGYYHAKQYTDDKGGLFLDADKTIPLYKDGDNYYKDEAKTIPLYKADNDLLYINQDKTRALYMPRQSANDTNPIVTFEGKPHTVPDVTTGQYDDPLLNIISCTSIGMVFGGGLGTGATLYGNPSVNINMIPGVKASDMTTNETYNSIHLGEIGTVYGGGYAADVIGDPTVNIGTLSSVDEIVWNNTNDEPVYESDGKTPSTTSKTVLGAYITGNVFGGGKGEADNFLCDKAMIGKDGAGAIDADGDGELDTEGGTTVNIFNGFVRGNVYGGGQIGRVEKNTVVTIGTGDGVAPGGTATSAPIIMGSVYGGGAGEEEHGYAALVRGNPTVTIQGNAKVRHSVYGGGEIASVARYNVPRTEEAVQAAKEEGYTEAVLGMPYALKDPNSGTCTVTVRGYAEIGPETAMQMTKAGGPDDTGYVFGAGKGILPGGEFEFEQGTTRRMVLYDAKDHPSTTQGTKWQWVDYPNHSESNNNVWEYFDDLDEYIRFIQTLALSSRTDVTITGNAFVKGSVYGGSENGIVQFNTDVKIQGGQIGAGDGMTEPYKETDWAGTPTNGWKECASWTFVEPYAPYDPYATTQYEGKYYYDTNHTQEAAGGASVATDGHTYYGNVFGGGSGSVPYFDHTLGRSVYLHSAGQVKGNTNVTISGGHILTNVYGGNEATNVDGTANVTMTDGTVGVPRTDEQIIAHPLTGYIFGGGKGDQRVFFNKDTNVKDAIVTIEGGRIYGSVYGGGEDGHVLRNVTLTIGKQTTTGEGNNAVTTTSGPKIGTNGTSYYDGHVFGGGRGFGGDALTAGNVGGSVDVNILDGEILGSVYGGGRLASVGYGLYLVDEEVTIGGSTVKPYGTMRPDDVYDDPSKPISTTEAAQFFNKGRGHINITISGGTIGNGDEYAYDASNPISHTKGGNVFAGGMGRMYELDGTTPISSLDWWKLGCVKSTKLTITGGTIKSNVYGGGELGQVVGYHTTGDAHLSTEITIQNTNNTKIGTEVKETVTTPAQGETPASTSEVTSYTFGSVFGGGYGSLLDQISYNVTVNGETTTKTSYPKFIAGLVSDSTKIDMQGGKVLACIYGGGEMASVDGSTDVRVSGGFIGLEPITVSGTKRYFGGAKMGNVYGGGSGHNNTVRSGRILKNTNVNISGGNIYHNVYGGGAYGTVGDFKYLTGSDGKVSGIEGFNSSSSDVGVARVKITGGTIGYDGKENGMVFGSSRGDINKPLERDDYTAWVYDAHVIIGSSGQGTTLTTPLVKGSVYGSGENGHTYHDTEVIIHSGTIGITEDETDDNGTPEDTTDDITTPGAAYPYRGNVYGAGCGTDKYYENHAVETHDGNGQLFNPLAGIVYGTTTVNIKGGQVVRNVYGAGAMGSVGRTVTTTTTEGETTTTTTTITGGTTTINVSGGRIGVDGTVGDGNVFGAARGNADAVSNEAALVRKETTVSVTGGTVKGNVYGGGELGCVGEYTISSDYRTFTWQDTDGVTNTDNNTKNTGICNVEIDGSSAVINGNVFGAGKGKEDTFWCEKGIAYSTNVNISKGTVNGNVYGGGEVGRVETDTKVKIGDGVGTVGGASAPTITGSVFGGGAGVETHGYSALVRGNTTVTVEGNATVGHSVYGGGEIASVGKYALDAQKMPSILQGGGYCYVTVKGHAAVDDVFGAGKGVTPHFDKDNADLSKRSRRMTLKDNWESLKGDARFDWDYLTSEDDYSTYLETLALATHPEVTIDGSAAVSGSVFGGGELGLTKGSVIVNIQGGTITEDVYGGGSLANTNTTSSVDRDGDGVADDTPVHPTTKVNLKGGTINRNVYGGGLGRLAKAAVGTEGQAGYISAVTAVEAKVYGDVLVELNKPVTETTGEGESTTTPPTYGDCVVKGTIFGANNLNGSPQKDVTVHVYKTVTKSGDTVNTKPQKNTDTYELEAVYGGGNLAAFYPDDVTARATAKANVIIDGCDLTSIKSVYGGGNAASTPATEVTVNGTYEIGSVFGGGNGYDNYILDGKEYQNPGANVGYQSYAYHVTEGETGYNVSTHGSGTSADPYKALEYGASDGVAKDASTKANREANYAYGSGKTQVNIYGGTVHAVYGGSNSKGNVREAAVALLDGDSQYSSCDFNVDEAYGGGKNADMDGTATLQMMCIKGLKEVYGGAKDADVNSDVVLNITNGTYDQVFGGNNVGGRISGSITVNIEETGCNPVIIGELYGGGNKACYSIYGYTDSGETDEYGKTIWLANETKQTGGPEYDHPTINVHSFTSIGNIFGGGLGETAVMVGDPYIYIDVVKGRWKNYVGESNRYSEAGYMYDANGYKGITKTIGGNEVTLPAHKPGDIGAISNVYGGGNMAEVKGTPHVYVCTKDKIRFATDDPSTTEVDESATDQTPVGVTILGNVYGGGNNAAVTGDTDVQIGRDGSTATP